MITILSDTPSILDQYLRELRDSTIQTDQHRFQNNLERIGMLCGYEVSKLLNYKVIDTNTPLATTASSIVSDKLVVATVLRAGLPVHRGIQQVLDGAELAFIGAGRKPENGTSVEIELSYIAAPSLAGKVLIMADTMIATGKSLVEACTALQKDHGAPARIIIVGVIASQPGIDYLQSHLPDAELIVCAVDPQLDDRFFIVPGLGDAGDLLFGPKAERPQA